MEVRISQNGALFTGCLLFAAALCLLVFAAVFCAPAVLLLAVPAGGLCFGWAFWRRPGCRILFENTQLRILRGRCFLREVRIPAKEITGCFWCAGPLARRLGVGLWGVSAAGRTLWVSGLSKKDHRQLACLLAAHHGL